MKWYWDFHEAIEHTERGTAFDFFKLYYMRAWCNIKLEQARKQNGVAQTRLGDIQATGS